MKRLFLDTNVILDVLLERRPFCDAAKRICELAEEGKITAGLSAISINNVFYIVRKNSGSARAYEVIETLDELFTVVALTQDILRKSRQDRWPDLEDAVQCRSAETFKAAYLLSRDAKGFKRSPIKVVMPHEYLALRDSEK